MAKGDETEQPQPKIGIGNLTGLLKVGVIVQLLVAGFAAFMITLGLIFLLTGA
ncbi:MAG: hypothetical protein V1735_06320 [Nanoarchaeota archaeon]